MSPRPCMKILESSWIAIALAILSTAAWGADATTAAPPAQISDPEVLHVAPRLLVLTAQCTNTGTLGNLRIAVAVRDQEGLLQSEGEAPRFCGSGSQKMQFLINIPDGTGALQTSEVVFSLFAQGNPKPFTQRFPLPPQPVMPLPPLSGVQLVLARMRGPDPPYLASYRFSFDLNDFGAVDHLLTRLDRDNVKLANGMSADEEYWAALWEKLTGPDGSDWSTRFLAWSRTSPKSPAALLAGALAMRQTAWSIRGGGTDNTLDPTARALFLKKMAQVEQMLRAHRGIGTTSPLYFELLMSIVSDEGKPNAQIEEIGATALGRFPEHLEIYVEMADPRGLYTMYVDPDRETSGHVDWVHADQLVNLGIHQGRDPQASKYALVYRALFARQPVEFQPFSDSLATWNEMKPSFNALMQKYPSSSNLNSFAAFSCRAGDWENYRLLRSKLDPENLDPRQWPTNFQPQTCDAIAAQSK
jgi:hypothetical protein